MASPQLENGYLRLSNELAEAIMRTPFNGTQFRILFTVARECYGRNGGQKLAPLSLRQIARKTELNLRSVRREVTTLRSAGILVRQGDIGEDCEYGLAKDYESWRLEKLGQKVRGSTDPQGVNSRTVPGVNRPPLEAVNRPPHRRKGRKNNSICEPDGSHAFPLDSSERNPCMLFSEEKNQELAAVKRIWDYYILRLDKNPKLLTLTPLRKQKGFARLKECLCKTGGNLEKAEELLKLAVDALSESAFHRGENEQKKRYDCWEKNLFTSVEKLEWWLEKANG